MDEPVYPADQSSILQLVTVRALRRHFYFCSNQRRRKKKIPDLESGIFVCSLETHDTKADASLTKSKSDTCDEQSPVPAGLAAPSLQPHEADLQLLLIGLRSREDPAVARFLHHDGAEREPADLEPPRQSGPGG